MYRAVAFISSSFAQGNKVEAEEAKKNLEDTYNTHPPKLHKTT